MINWPPTYAIRYSKKSKYVHLQLCPKKGLEVVIPSKHKAIDINALLIKNKDWLYKNANLLTPSIQPSILPSVVKLQFLDERWHVIYIHDKLRKRVKRTACPYQKILIIEAPNNDKHTFAKHLIIWLKQKAQETLYPLLMIYSNRMKLPVKKVTFGRQKTLWGSCSKEAEINLNIKLLFLPEPLVHYICIHELCHIVHFNHSRVFWQLVEKYDPHYQYHRNAMKHADHYLPSLLK